MNVPFLDLKAQNDSIRDEVQAALEPILRESQFILGPGVDRFEADFAKYIGVDHCVGLNNGTSALHLALQAYDIGPGDEVITTPHTWISTTWALSYVRATPIYVDIDPVTYNLSAELVEQAITPRTRAILPVHLYGQAADVVALRAIAEKHDLVLIEDAAQAHGAIVAGKRVGSFGQIACFSFYPGKNLGAFGEGGAVVTNDPDVAARIRRLRDHAQASRHHHVEVGHNMRMEGIQGAVLQVKLRHLDRWNHKRREHAALYRKLLADLDSICVPEVPDELAHVWHLFVIVARGMDRERLRGELSERQIATAVHYPTPVPFQPAYRHLGYQSGDFPVAEEVMGNCISLPMFAELNDSQIHYVADALRSACSSTSMSNKVV